MSSVFRKKIPMKIYDRIGVNELRKNLGRYLRKAKQGRMIVVTLRGQSVAVLMAAESHFDVQVARELSRKGIGSWNGGKPKGVSRPVVITGRPLSQIVLEERP
jgi:prevent-host-death family protein